MIRSSIAVLLLATSAVAAEPTFYLPPKHGNTYVIAHRGAHLGIPENSLAAYRRAIELGADFIEIDVRTSKDGEFVCIHNSTIDAYVDDGTTAQVRDLTLRQLQAIDIGRPIHSRWTGQRIPTLDEVLSLSKHKIGIYLDLKSGSIPAVAEQIQRRGMQQQVVWCIAPDKVDSLRTACPECIAMPDPGGAATLPKLLEQTSPTIVAPVWNDFSSTFAATCHAANALVFVDEREATRTNWQQALQWGADGIQTDDPESLIALLRESNDQSVTKPPTDMSGTVRLAKLTAGTSRIDLTPPPQMKAALGGYGERMSRPAEGIHDRIFAKGLVVVDPARQRRFALLTADILGFPPAFKPALVRRLADDGWKSDQIMLLASHSHTSIDMNAINPANILGNKQIGLYDKPLFEWTLQRLATAIRQAAGSQVPVAVGTSSRELEDWNRNRRQRGGVTDKSLTVTRVDRLDGRPLAVLVNFTAHPTFMSAEHMLFSGGWPGHLQRSLERTIGTEVNVLYYNGAEGDQSPVGQPGFGGDRWEAAQRYGQGLARQAYELWKQAQLQRKIAFGFHTETIKLPSRVWHPDFMKTGGDEYGLSEELLEYALPVLFPAETSSGSLRLGELLIVGIPGEMAAQLGLVIKGEAAQRVGVTNVTIGGLADAWISYILSPAEYDRGGYEASVSFYGRDLGDRIVQGAISGASQLRSPNEAGTGH